MKFFRFIVGFLFTITSIFVVLLTTLNFQITQENFWLTVFSGPKVYGTAQKSITIGLQDYALSMYAQQKKTSVDQLTQTDRNIVQNQVKAITEKLTPTRLQMFSEENIKRILGFVNGSLDELILYTPFEEWGLVAEGQTDTIPSEVNVLTILTQTNNTDLASHIASLHGGSRKIRVLWVVALAAAGVLFIFYLSLNSPKNRLIALTQITIPPAIFILLMSFVLKMLVGLSAYQATNPNPLMTFFTILLPLISYEITKLWLSIGSCMALFGLSALALQSLRETKQAKNT